MDKWLYLQDTCGVHNLHGLPGVFSGIAATIAALVARKAETDDNHMAYGDRYVRYSGCTIRMLYVTHCILSLCK